MRCLNDMYEKEGTSRATNLQVLKSEQSLIPRDGPSIAARKEWENGAGGAFEAFELAAKEQMLERCQIYSLRQTIAKVN